MRSDELDDLRLSDVLTFFAVHRTGSVTNAARELQVTPSYVSKSIVRLERQLAMTLLTRGKLRVSVSDAGLRALPVLEELVARLRQLAKGEPETRTLTVAAPSYLQSFCLPRIAACRADLRVRGCELPPALVRAYAAENLFEVTLTLGAQPLPRSFSAISVGPVRKGLFATPEVAGALGKPPISVERVKQLTFVAPTYISNGQFLPADDDCPLALGERRLGHEVTTVALAFEIALHTGQVVFGPSIAARPFVRRELLVEIPVKGWDVHEELIVGCNSDRVRSAEQRAIVEALRSGLAEEA
jgi:DNA-binding transcriptional LysR family regulator